MLPILQPNANSGGVLTLPSPTSLISGSISETIIKLPSLFSKLTEKTKNPVLDTESSTPKSGVAATKSNLGDMSSNPMVEILTNISHSLEDIVTHLSSSIGIHDKNKGLLSPRELKTSQSTTNIDNTETNSTTNIHKNAHTENSVSSNISSHPTTEKESTNSKETKHISEQVEKVSNSQTKLLNMLTATALIFPNSAISKVLFGRRLEHRPAIENKQPITHSSESHQDIHKQEVLAAAPKATTPLLKNGTPTEHTTPVFIPHKNRPETRNETTTGTGSSSSGVSRPEAEAEGESGGLLSKLAGLAMLPIASLGATLRGIMGFASKLLLRLGLVGAAIYAAIEIFQDPRFLDVVKGIETFVGKFSGLYDNVIKPVFEKLWTGVKDIVFSVFGTIIKVFNDGADDIAKGDFLGFFKHLIENLSEGLYNVTNSITKIFGINLDGIISFYSDYISKIFGDITTDFKNGDWVGLIGNLGKNLGNLLYDTTKNILGFFGVDVTALLENVTKFDWSKSIAKIGEEAVALLKSMSDWVISKIKGIGSSLYETLTTPFSSTPKEVSPTNQSKTSTTPSVSNVTDGTKYNPQPEENKSGFFSNMANTMNRVIGGDRDLKSFLDESGGNKILAERNYMTYLTTIKKMSTSAATSLVESQKKYIPQYNSETNTSTSPLSMSQNERSMLEKSSNNANMTSKPEDLKTTTAIARDKEASLNRVSSLAQTTNKVTEEKEARQEKMMSSPSISPVIANTNNSQTNVNTTVQSAGLSSAFNTSRQSNTLASVNRFD